MKTSCESGCERGDCASVLTYPTGKSYLGQIGLTHPILLSKGLRTGYLDKVGDDARDLRLWDILWMFQSRSVLGFSANGVTVYGVCGLDDGEGATPLAVEAQGGLSHTIMLPGESGRLDMTADRCRMILKSRNTPGDSASLIAKMVKAVGCYDIPCRITFHAAEGGRDRKHPPQP